MNELEEVRVVSEDDYSVISKIANKMSVNEEITFILKFTETHKRYEAKFERELECLNVLFPTIFHDVKEEDEIVGSIDILPVGIGTTTTVGGVGYYCQFDRLKEIINQQAENSELYSKLVDAYEYWEENDSREKFFKDNLIANELGKFVDIEYPAIVTTRLSGMFLDYNKLIDNGITGLKKIINDSVDCEFNESLIKTLDIFQNIIDKLILSIKVNCDVTTSKWDKMLASLENIREEKPKTFIEAMELTWIYSLFSTVINYGRMDDYLGEFLVNDLESGELSWDEALILTCDLFKKMEQRRTLANSRVIIGGKGRKNEQYADVFCKLAIEAVGLNKDIEPQLTLRYYDGMNNDVYELALEVIGQGTTFPIIYNDDVNIESVKNAMEIPWEDAEQYVPLGCGEINISGKGVSTPNTCLNMLKILTICLNGGIDPVDNLRKDGGVELLDVSMISSFDQLLKQYKKLLDYYIDICAVGQAKSYEYLNNDISFLATSLLTDDCITRGKAVLDGGVKYLGGTNETYGNISTFDSLVAIKKVVYDDKSYTFPEVMEAINANFVGFSQIKNELLNAPKFGNDDDYADKIACDLHEYVCTQIRDKAKSMGVDYYLVVVINNQIGTQWGTRTFASPNGRQKFDYMSNGVNPQSGCDYRGPTAMLNSISKLSTNVHAGSVQNIKFSKETYKHRSLIKGLVTGYFESGGSQLMISVVGKKDLEQAMIEPEKYKNLVVRVGGFSARFIDLNKNVQREILDRTLN